MFSISDFLMDILIFLKETFRAEKQAATKLPKFPLFTFIKAVEARKSGKIKNAEQRTKRRLKYFRGS